MIKVAIIEDDIELRTLVSDLLSHESDFSVVAEFGDAESAISELGQPVPDVVLVDINLPGQSGIDCVRHLKLRLPGTQFVMVTMYEDTERIFRALEAGATGYLLKRSVADELIGALRDVHAGGSPMSGLIARKVVQCFHVESPRVSPTAILSDREKQVLDLLLEGYLYKEISDRMNCGMGTINTYVRRIYEKLHVHSRKEAIEMLKGG